MDEQKKCPLNIKGKMNVKVAQIIEETDRVLRGLQAAGNSESVHPHIYMRGYQAGVKALQDIVLTLQDD